MAERLSPAASKKALVICWCGEMLPARTPVCPVCRKVGQCACGKWFEDDAEFCDECGEVRDEVQPGAKRPFKLAEVNLYTSAFWQQIAPTKAPEDDAPADEAPGDEAPENEAPGDEALADQALEDKPVVTDEPDTSWWAAAVSRKLAPTGFAAQYLMAVEATAAAARVPELLQVSGVEVGDVVYELQDGMHRNGFPVWKQFCRNRWIFSSPKGFWIVGGPLEERRDFDCECGFLSTTARHGGMMPHTKGHGSWVSWDGHDWVNEPDVAVMTTTITQRAL